MKIVAFAEGRRGASPGLVGTIMILKSTAAHGHGVVLLMGGDVTPGRENFVVRDAQSALRRKEGEGFFGIVCVKARTHWRFCPSILWRFSKLVRDSDFVTLHSLYSFPVLAGYLLARWHRKPYGIWPHGVLAPFQRQVSARKKWLYNKIFAERILQNASVIFYSAAGEREEAAPLNLRAPSVVVPDGFNADEFTTLPERGQFRARFLDGHKGPMVLFLARLNAKKGLDLLIKAMRLVVAVRPEVRLAIVGPPDPPSFKKEVLQWIEESGIGSQTVLPGPAGPELRLQAYADADLFVLPSWAENFGNAIFEASACGIPVVVSDTLNYAAEFAQHGAGVALHRTPEDFSAAIIELLDQPETRRRMGECGKVFARRYSLEETGAKIGRTMECILSRLPFPEEVAPRMIPGVRQQST